MLDLRSMLYVPGDRPDRIAKALSSGAKAVTVDLEDAVAVTNKPQARAGVVSGIGAAAEIRCTVGVRANSLASGLFSADLDALTAIWARLDYLLIAMVPNAEAVRQAAAACAAVDARTGVGEAGPRLIPLIETASAVLAAPQIAAAHARVHTLAFGPADLSHQLGVTPSAGGMELQHARSQLVLAAAASELAGPIDGPWMSLDDLDGLRLSAAHARALGFAGKQVLHPKQLQIVHETFSITSAELEWARAVDDAFSRAEAAGVSSVKLADGTFVDYPVAYRARAILAAHRQG